MATKKPVSRPFPRRTMEDALRIPTALKEKNGGQAWAPQMVAAAIGLGMSSNFYYISAASRDFGFTDGSRETAQISLRPLGRQAVYPGTPEERTSALRQAFFNVPLYKELVDYYGGSKLPDEPFRTNTLTSTFGLDPSTVSEFVELFEKNARFVGIGTSYQSQRSDAAAVVGIEKSELVGTPSTKNAEKEDGETLRCFIAMPFGERDEDRPIGFFTELLNSLLIPAITDAGFEAFTAKRQGSDVIQSTIVNDLLDADLVLVDLTEHNPNVLFELGMRMHADKPVALIRAKGTGAIFDVDNLLRVEEYDPNLWTTTVQNDMSVLTEHVKAAWSNRDTTQTFMKILKAQPQTN